MVSGHGDSNASPNRGAISRPTLRRELSRRRDAGQAVRESLIAKRGEGVGEAIAVDDDNTAWLKTIVDEFGWPGKSMVGEEGAHAAWLLAQHADRDPAFQQRCLDLLIRAVAQGEASPPDAAHLTDRVRLAEGKSQVYGTQLIGRDGRYMAPRLDAPSAVDDRRAAVGLSTLAEHIQQAAERHGPPRPARSRCRKCKAPMEVWLPELGGSTMVRCSACGSEATIRARGRKSAQAGSRSG